MGVRGISLTNVCSYALKASILSWSVFETSTNTLGANTLPGNGGAHSVEDGVSKHRSCLIGEPPTGRVATIVARNTARWSWLTSSR